MTKQIIAVPPRVASLALSLGRRQHRLQRQGRSVEWPCWFDLSARRNCGRRTMASESWGQTIRQNMKWRYAQTERPRCGSTAIAQRDDGCPPQQTRQQGR